MKPCQNQLGNFDKNNQMLCQYVPIFWLVLLIQKAHFGLVEGKFQSPSIALLD